MMKNLFFKFSVCAILTLISCGNDDGPNESEQGTWKLINRTEVGDGQDPLVLDCEKLTTYKFDGNKAESIVYEANDKEDGCIEPYSSTVNYKIENSKIIILDDQNNPIETNVTVEIRVFEDEMILVYRDPKDAPSSSLKRETFERQ